MKKAQSLVEYTLILVLISLIAIATWNFLGNKMTADHGEAEIDTRQNIVETMTQYCQIKGLVYDVRSEKCIKSVKELPKK